MTFACSHHQWYYQSGDECGRKKESIHFLDSSTYNLLGWDVYLICSTLMVLDFEGMKAPYKRPTRNVKLKFRKDQELDHN